MIYGKQAEYLCNCTLPKGTKLVVVGDLVVEDRPEWTDNSGVTHEATSEVTVRAKSVSVEINNWYDITVTKHPASGASVTQTVASAPKRQTTTTKKATPAPKVVKQEQPEEDIFGSLTEDSIGSDDTVDLWG